MGEKIDACSKEFPGFFVLAAIVQAKNAGEKINTNPVDVTLLVNGIEMPFTETMNDIYRRMEDQIDGRAREIAEKMVTEAGLDGVAEALREVELKVREALRTAKV